MTETTTVRPSKENAAKAREHLSLIQGGVAGESLRESCEFLRAFIDAAARKLPSDAAIERDRNRKRNVRESARNAS